MAINHINKFSGRVVALKANYFFVEIQISCSESIRLLCTKRHRLNYQGLYISVGDNVIVESIDWKKHRGVISHIAQRSSYLERPSVANVTNIMVLVSVSEPVFDLYQTSRFLLTAETTNLDVTLVLTKVDLVPNPILNTYINNIKSWGYDPFPISIKNNFGIDLLISKLKSSKLSVLCGPSGVGKTSLINYLLPELSQPTASVSQKLQRGVNTTRHVELFSLGGEALVADTPGFNRPEVNITPRDLAFLFPELRQQLTDHRCKFRDCLHRDEPGCVIDKTIARYSFYRENLEELLSSPLRIQED